MGNAVIYRPAYDAEVEYLESTGTQWIDTGIVLQVNDVLEITLCNTTKNFIENKGWGTGNGTTSSVQDLCGGLRYTSSGRIGDWFFGTPYIYTPQPSVSPFMYYKEVVTFNSSISTATLYDLNNDLTYTIDFDISSKVFPENPVYIFRANSYYSHPGKKRVKSFIIKRNNVVIEDLIPVRIGQVGYLYDKVTKQLFANKGTGNFVLGNDVSNAVIPQQRCVLYFGNQRSVIYERIYEEYEWLHAVSGGEYITLAGGSNTDSNAYVRTTYKCNYNSGNSDISIGGSKNVSNNQCIRIFNASSTTFIDVHKWTNGTQTSYRKQVSGGSSGVERSLYVTLTNWQVDNQSGTVTLGTAFDTGYDYQATRLLFPNNSYAYKRTQMRTNNKEFDLIPCKLLQSIPASLAANGIARQAGECGMWDKVSNRFYGNVANSGTFTVSND